MVARTFKSQLMQKWRELKSSLDEDYQQLAVDYFNLLFGKSSSSPQYWKQLLIPLLREKFPLTSFESTREEGSPPTEENLDAVDFQSIVDRLALFYRLQDLTGIRFSLSQPQEEKEEEDNNNQSNSTNNDNNNTSNSIKSIPPESDQQLELLLMRETPFNLSHMPNITARLKHIHRISFEEGTALSRLAITKEGIIVSNYLDSYLHNLVSR